MAATKWLTLEQFLKREETKPASEYVCGEAIRKPMPDFPHSRLQGYFMVLLYQFLSTHRLGEVLPEFRCIFGPLGAKRAYVPDLVFVSRDRLPRGQAQSGQFLYAAPDLAIEVLSRRQNARRFAEKIEFYLRHGVRLVWVIDPMGKAIDVYAPGEEMRVLRAGDALDGGDVLPGFSVPVDDIFAQLQV